MKANLFQNSQIVYFDTTTTLSLKPNSYLRFLDQNYKIQLYNKLKKQFTYNSIDKDIITLPRESLNFIMRGDTISVQIPTYCLSTILKIESDDKFKIGDIIKETSSDNGAIFMVTSVDENANIKSVDIQSNGVYKNKIEDDNLNFELLNGKKCKIYIKAFFEQSGNQYIDAVVKLISPSATQIALNLNCEILPFNCSGSVYIEKYSVVLRDEYVGETLLEQNCHISNDFTPHLELPFAVPNTPSLHVLYNETISILDKRIKDLEDKINQLNIGQ